MAMKKQVVLTEDRETPVNEMRTTVVHTEPIETTVKIGAEVDSKGNTKPHADITIHRKLPAGADIETIIVDDIVRGVAEVRKVIAEFVFQGQQA